MTAKEFLNRARSIDREITALEASRTKAMERCLSVTTKPKDTIVSGESSTGEDKLIAFVDLSRQIDEAVDRLCNVKTEILSVINRVDDGILRTLLIERYISCRTWEQIAVDMNYSYMQVCRLHGRALILVEEIISEG